MDDYTFRVVFQDPRLRFLQGIAECERQITACPKHYLKQFRPDYTTPAELDQRLDEAGIDGWPQLWETKQDPRLEPPFSFQERPISIKNPNVNPQLEAAIMRAVDPFPLVPTT